ncbi:NAD(P)/FAD-dependent oxidoreductase [Ammoniphilus sp. 3BR4]|uniref:NAD(P)/FAD-dependent oxidoreductase n=1 Tax=Ammoniphilus sp. 3BR4 TaxID=3158265 RepID=UPI003467CAF9
MKTDVLVLGGGLAGMAAAYETASRGLSVTIVDESRTLGGQLKQQTQVLNNMPAPYENWRGYELAAHWVKKLQDVPIDYLLGHSLIGLYADGRFGLSNGEQLVAISADHTIVATGAAECPAAFPGWTLPGIMTIGAAQILINREWVYPGKTGLILGSSDFALEMAIQMNELEIKISAIVEKSEQITCQDPTLIHKVNRLNIPIYLNTGVLQARGNGRVESVTIADRGNDQLSDQYQVDFIAIDAGRHPILEPFTMLSCDLLYDDRLGGWLPGYSHHLETSEKGVFVAGNAGGITNQAGILLSGRIAGLSVAERVHKLTERDNEEKQALWETLCRVESAPSLRIWEARVKHMEKFMNHRLPLDPQQWSLVSREGRLYRG